MESSHIFVHYRKIQKRDEQTHSSNRTTYGIILAQHTSPITTTTAYISNNTTSLYRINNTTTFSPGNSTMSSAPSRRVFTASLEDLTSQLAGFILLGGVIIFYHNDASQFSYFRRDDNVMWREAYVDLKLQISRGVITAIKSDDPIVVEASGPNRMMRTPLYPMLVTFKHVSCPAYFLLKKSGDITLNDYTPYFFTSKEVRDAIVSKLTELL